MKTCGECVHFEFARGITGRQLPTKRGRCNGPRTLSVWAKAYIAYNGETLDVAARPVYVDSEMASQCSAFEEKICAAKREGVYTPSTPTKEAAI